jgi:transposase
MPPATAFPDDLAACHAMLAEMGVALTKKDATLANKDSVIEQLEHRVEEQKRELAKVSAERDAAFQLAFRKRQERYLDDPSQFLLDFGDNDDTASFADGIADAADEQDADAGGEQASGPALHAKRPRKRRNEQLPEHLPRYEVLLPVPEDKKICPTHGERKVIGYDWLETLEITRPKLVVRRTGIPKLACPADPSCGIAEAKRPPGLIEGNRYDTSVAAEVIAWKYGYHCPVYRQQDIFGSSGWTPARSTLQNLLKAAALLVRPLVESFHDLVRAGPVVGTDDTTVTLVVNNAPLPPNDCPKNERALEVIAKAREQQRGSITARMWVYRCVTIPINVFDFTVSRHRDGPAQFLQGFTGSLMADCYAGYEAIHTETGGLFTRAACVTHARRKVFEAADNHPIHASRLLAWFKQLYDIEDRAKELSPADRQRLRDAEARPLWKQIAEYIDGPAVSNVLPNEQFGKALGYLRNHYDQFVVYLDDGLVPIDNNDAEQLMKQVALGRKNWLVIGSVAAGYRAADLMTLVSSAIRNDLDVAPYLKDVLDRLLAGESDFHSMRPDIWKQSHPEAVRVYRQEERRDRADAKRTRRDRRRKAAIAAK